MRKVAAMFVVAAALLMASAVSASSADAISLDPAVVHLTMKPGEVWRGQVRVSNEGGSAVTLVSGTASLVGDETGDTIEMSEDISRRIGTIASWLVPSVGAFTIPSGERAWFAFAVQVPENASPGSHRGLITLTRVQEQPQGNALSVTAAVAIGVDLTVVGQPNHHISLARSGVSPRIGTKPPLEVTATVANAGNTLPVVRAVARIGRILGSEGFAIPMNVEQGSDRIAPGAATVFRGVWDGSGMTPVGIFRVRVVATDSSGEFTDSHLVILLPWQVFVGVGVAALIVLLGRRQWRRFIRPRRPKK